MIKTKIYRTVHTKDDKIMYGDYHFDKELVEIHAKALINLSDYYHYIRDIRIEEADLISYSDDEINDFEDQLEECECIVYGSVILPPHYWNHRKKYTLIVHPENKRLYTDRKYHERYFRKLKK